MSRIADRVRCYNCGRPSSRDAATCGRCGATFRALCPCGADICIYDDECPACRTPHVPKRMPLRRHPYVRAAKWSALALVVSFAAYAVFSPRVTPAWKLKSEGHKAYDSEDYETAAKKYRAVTEQSPGDAEGWYMYALCLRQTGVFAADVYVPLAEKAALLNPGLFAVRNFLARCELEAGHVDRALEHAEAAVRSPEADGRAFQLLAEIEMRRPQPSLPRVQQALERARASGVDTPEVKVLLAEVSLRLYGVTASDVGRLPPGVSVALREAASALEQLGARGGDPGALAAVRARVLLALGRKDDAYAAAAGALDRLPSGAPVARAAELRLLRAMALHARGSRAEAMVDFAKALDQSPDARTAATAAAYLIGEEDADAARALLANAAANDPAGAVHAVLADVLLRSGKLDRAEEAIKIARGIAPADASFAEIEGALFAARGLPVDARRAFDEASRLAPTLVSPRVGAALSILAGVAGPTAKQEALLLASKDLEAVRAQFGDDPRVLAAIGRVRLEQDDFEGACEALEKAKDAAPADPVVWCNLAIARRRSKAPDAVARAADAYGRARTLLPNDASLVLAEADARLESDEAGAAAEVCVEHLRAHPDDQAVLARLAEAHLQLSMWSAAAADLKRLRDLRRDDENILKRLVYTLYRAGDAPAARRTSDEAAKTASSATVRYLDFLATIYAGDPEAAIAKLSLAGPSTLLAEAQLATGRVDDAIATLRAERARRPDDAYLARLLVVALVDADPPQPARVAEARGVAASLPADAPRGLRELLEGRLLLAEGRDADAAKALAVAARDLTADPFAALFYGEALFRSGERNESLAALRRAATSPAAPPSMRALVAARLVAAAAERKDDASAERLLREALRYAPQNFDAAQRLASLLQSRGAQTEAAEVAEHALQVPDLPPAQAVRMRYLAASARLSAGQFVQAQGLIERLRPEDRSSTLAGLLAGFAALGAGRAADADARFAEVLAGDPTVSVAQLGRVQAALVAGKADAAVALAESWRAAHPADRAFVVNATRFLVARGSTDAAAALVKRALDAAPDDVVLGVEFARTKSAAGHAEDGVAAFRDVVARVPVERRAAAELRLGALLLATPELAADAVVLARRIIGETTSNETVGLEARILEAEALYAARRASEAEAAAQTLVKRWTGPATPPDEPLLEARVRFVLGSAAGAEPRRRGEALEHLRRCHELVPDDDAAANNLAWILGERPTTAADGAALAKRVTARVGGVPRYWDTRAACSAAAGDETDAVGAWKRALDLYAAVPGADVEARARTALRFAAFLVSKKRAEDARAVVVSALDYTRGTPSEAEVRRFLAGLGGS